MMKQQLDFDNIELSFYERLVLKTIPIFKSAFFYNKRTIDDLLTLGLISRSCEVKFNHFCYKVTHNGKMYFRYKRKRMIIFMVPVVISVIALLAAYDVVYIKWLHELLSKLVSLLKTILESLGIST